MRQRIPRRQRGAHFSPAICQRKADAARRAALSKKPASPLIFRGRRASLRNAILAGDVKIVPPSTTERNELFKSFARALYNGDMDALYRVVTQSQEYAFDA